VNVCLKRLNIKEEHMKEVLDGLLYICV